MRTTACFWLLSALFIVNLQRLPSSSSIIVFLVALATLALRVPLTRQAVLGVLLAVATLGASFYQLASHQLAASHVSKDLTVTVLIDSVPDKQPGRLSFVAQVLSCESCSPPLRAKKIRLSWYGNSPELNAGELWRLTVRLKPPASLRNAGGFDAVPWSLVKGLHAKGYVREAASARRVQNSRLSLSALRQNAAEKLTALAGDSARLGLLQALTVGVKTHITNDQWSVLRNTGTAHLMAISGLHVGLVAGWVLLFGKRAAAILMHTVYARTEGRYSLDLLPVMLACALLASIFYAALAGFELPTQRAVLMLSVWMIAALRFRFLPPMTALAVALLAVLSMNPLSLMSAGFWLSFGTVAALFYLHRGHQSQANDADSSLWQRAQGKARALSRTHVSLGIVLLPVTAWFFQAGSLVAPFANLVAVPWVAIISVPLALLALLASYFSHAVAAVLLRLADGSLQALISFLNWLDLSALSSVVLTLPGTLAFVLVILGLLVLFAPRGLGLRWLAMPLFFPALLFNSNLTHVSEEFEVHALDVGQGLAVLVFAGEHTLLFDTGGKVSPGLSMFEAVVVPFLHASGRRKVDTLVISHGDEDHAFGVDDVLRRYSDVHVFSSQLTDVSEVYPVSACHAGIQWASGGVQFAFVHPASSDKGSDNNLSCVLLIHKGDSRVLLTGDIEASAELRLVSRLNELQLSPVTLLTAPHHGSISSSTQAFVDITQPEYVVFPSGHRNRYGFPHRDVQLRYKLSGSTSFVTGKTGAVSFAFGNEGLSALPTTWWDSRRRFWHGIVNPDCWQQVAGQSLALRLLALSQKGQILCGK